MRAQLKAVPNTAAVEELLTFLEELFVEARPGSDPDESGICTLVPAALTRAWYREEVHDAQRGRSRPRIVNLAVPLLRDYLSTPAGVLAVQAGAALRLERAAGEAAAAVSRAVRWRSVQPDFLHALARTSLVAGGAEVGGFSLRRIEPSEATLRASALGHVSVAAATMVAERPPVAWTAPARSVGAVVVRPEGLALRMGGTLFLKADTGHLLGVELGGALLPREALAVMLELEHSAAYHAVMENLRRACAAREHSVLFCVPRRLIRVRPKVLAFLRSVHAGQRANSRHVLDSHPPS